jgi:hypothetical protein
MAGPGWVCERWIGAGAPGAVVVAEGGVKVRDPREPMPPLLPLPGRASATGAASANAAASARMDAARLRRVVEVNMKTPLVTNVEVSACLACRPLLIW